MDIMVISNNPLRASFRQRIEIYLARLSESGITWRMEQFPKQYSRRWRLLREAKNYNAVLIHKKTLNVWDAMVLRKSARKIIYDFDDAIMYSPSQPDSDRSSHMRLFRRTARLADLIIAGNKYLADHARRFCSCVQILPTGLDTMAFESLEKTTKDDRIRLVWIGSRSTIPYLHEIRPLLERVGKQHPKAMLRVIADVFPELNNMEVEKCPWSPERQNQDLVDADIGLAPLPDNRFTRGKCGFKLLQYFAAGLPAVASGVGVNQTLIESSQAGFLPQSFAQWEDCLARLIRDRNLRQDLGRRAAAFVKQYDSRKIGDQLVELLCGFMD